MTIEELKAKANQGDFDALKELGQKMWLGKGIKKDKAASYEIWKKAYELNPEDSLVTRRLGCCYYFGYGVSEDDDTAKYYFLKSAEKEDSASQYFLGRIYQIRYDPECIKWYDKAARNGDMDAAVKLANIYLDEKLIHRNVEKSNEYAQMVDESNDADAALDMMRLYYFGSEDGRDKDIEKAIYWCKKAIERGSADAVYNLSTIYNEIGIDLKEYYDYLMNTAVAVNDEALIKAYKYYCEQDREENESVAFEYLSRAVSHEYPRAYYELGLVLLKGLCGQAVDKSKALEYWRLGAEKGDADSIVMVGSNYLYGEIIEKDVQKAIELLEQAAALNDVVAITMLGKLYFRGDEVPADYEKAYKYFSSIDDDEDAMAYLGLMHIYGRYFEKDNDKGIELILKAIGEGSSCGKGLLKEAFYNDAFSPEEDFQVCTYFASVDDDAESMWFLYLDYKNGNGVERDSEKADYWLSKAVSLGEARAINELGYKYYTGDGVVKNLKEAEKYCKSAAIKGSRNSVKLLKWIEQDLYGSEEGYKLFIEFILSEAIDCNDEAQLAAYEYYSDLNDPQYYDTAFNYLERALNNGNPFSYYKMGCVFFDGSLGRAMDKKSAIYYWLAGARIGDIFSMNLIGNAYVRGEEIPQDVEKGIKWLEKSYSGGNNSAAFDLAQYYSHGTFVEQDTEKAVHYYELAAAAGFPEAENEMGTYYLKGLNGIQKDEKKGFEFISRAAEKGDVFAQFNLGLCYFNGWGTDKDDEKAIYWWKKAAEKGHSDAIKNLKILEERANEPNSFNIEDGKLISYKGSSANINIPEGVHTISGTAFDGADRRYTAGIGKITLPSTLRVIEEGAFSNLLVPWACFDISENNEFFSVQNGVLFNKDKTELIRYPIDKADAIYYIPESVRKIAPNAFKLDQNLHIVIAFSDIEYIGENAFLSMKKLNSIDLSQTKITQATKGMCFSCRNLYDVSFPPSLKKIGWGAFFENSSINKIVLPEGLSEIDDCAFGNCSKLSSVNIPKTIKRIGNSAFGECTSLYSVTIPRGASVAENAFPVNCRVEYYQSSQAAGESAEKEVFATGATVEEAVERGKRLLNIGPNEEYNVDIIEMPKKGFLGIGAKDAMVKITRI